IPHIDVFLDSGYTKEEWKMMVETQKILDPDIQVTATCVRVPVFVGHSEAVTLEFERPITAEKARAALREAPGILVVDKREDGGYATPQECAGEDATYVSRIRKDPTVEHGLSLWVVSDNLRKGAALNAIQAEGCTGRSGSNSALQPGGFAEIRDRPRNAPSKPACLRSRAPGARAISRNPPTCGTLPCALPRCPTRRAA